MTNRRDDKYGSTYDPRNLFGGKRERELRDQYQTRGCGDPNCAQCNPETVGQGYGPGSFIPYANTESTMSYTAVPTTPSGPPQSYESAREAVSRWIVTVNEQDFSDIVGNAEALETLRDAIQAPVKHAKLYAAYSMKMPKGALLSGPPGCGKTMFARAAASEIKRLYGKAVEYLMLAGPELQTMFVGETEKHIKNLFSFAKEYKAYHGHPLLIFIDEAEVILPDRTGRTRRVAPWEESQVAQFLTEMDGVTDSGAFLLLASNRPETIDSAVLRDGRCDFKITVERPTREATEAILQKNFANILIGTDPVESLVFAALESLYDPHRILLEAHAFRLRLKVEGMEIKPENLSLETRDRHFLLEHIISGAMVASIPNRAIRYAFARDKATGIALGVLVSDVIHAVDTIFAENKGLEHAYAMEEFQKKFLAELNAAEKKETK